MGSVCSAIGRAINGVIAAIASVFMAIVGEFVLITSALRHHKCSCSHLELLPGHHLLPLRIPPPRAYAYINANEEILVLLGYHLDENNDLLRDC
ncbi:hypothetical protein FRC09_001687 [Ceratobasidium sp. 395]|nr:hypothetical protein FRC09_001687 [Ceratobasidium sp. 395]